MKKHTIILCLFNLFFSFSQEKEDKFINNSKDTLKVYLTDAETDKNIADAKVTLEGFEIPEIKGKYHKKRKFYYFTEVPQGYNTIMTYHKKYNEKGFQDIKGLPKELKLKLKNKNNNFFILPDNFYTEDIIKFKKEHNYKDYYIEDPFKIVIDIDMKYYEKRQYFLDLIKNHNLDIEMVNPFFEKNKMKNNEDSFKLETQIEGYPSLIAYDGKELYYFYILPLNSGINTLDDLVGIKYEHIIENTCFIFKKKDGTKFKRFNDPIIEKIKKLKLDVNVIVTYKNKDKTHPKNIIRDKINKKFNIKNVIDSSKIFFYDNQIRNKTKYKIKKENKKRASMYPSIYEPDLRLIPSFVLINTNTFKIRKISSEFNDFENFNLIKESEKLGGIGEMEIFTIPNQEHSIGLGLLDQYEYYANIKQ